MTIEAIASEVAYAGDGSTTAFTIPFPFDTSADITVIITDADGEPEEQSTGFSITGGNGSTGTCTFDVAPASGEIVTILDDPELTQPTDYPDNDSFPASAHEAALDRVTRQVKRLHQRVGRSLRVPDGDNSSGTDLLLPIEADRAGKFLVFGVDGQPTVATSGAGGDDDLRDDLAAGTASLVGATSIHYERTTAEINGGVTPTDYSYPSGDVRRYGIDITGAADCTSVLQSVIDLGGKVDCGTGTTLKIDGALTLDLARTTLEGLRCNWDMTGGGTLQVYRDTDFTDHVQDIWGGRVYGINFIGDQDVGHTLVTVGHASHAYSAEILFENCSFYKGATLVAFTDNAWRAHFIHCGFEQPSEGGAAGRFLSFPAGVTNAGEVMQFDHCWFANGTGDLYMYTGHFVFNGCSFGRRATIHAVNDVRVELHGCNIEAQADPGYRMIRVNGTSNVNVFGGQVVINAGDDFEMAPFLLEGADASLDFWGTHLPLAGAHLMFQNDVTYNLRHFAVGPGVCNTHHCRSYALASLTGTVNNVQIGKTSNLLTNGDAEYGNENGWTKTAAGGATGTAVASNTAELNGTYGFILTSPSATDTIDFRQDVALAGCAGRLFALSYAAKVATGNSATPLNISLLFLDKAGNSIASGAGSDSVANSVTTYSHRCIVARAPAGTHSIRAQFAVAGHASGNIVWLDEICLCAV